MNLVSDCFKSILCMVHLMASLTGIQAPFVNLYVAQFDLIDHGNYGLRLLVHHAYEVSLIR